MSNRHNVKRDNIDCQFRLVSMFDGHGCTGNPIKKGIPQKRKRRVIIPFLLV